MRLRRPQLDPVGQTLEFTFNGRKLTALAGETIAAAIAAHEIDIPQSQAGDSNSPWIGAYCGMGACFGCVVTVDGRMGQRACLTKLRGGEEVSTATPGGGEEDPLQPLTTPPTSSALPERQVDILIIGAGPAGLSAALAARKSGASVLVLDERSDQGGQYYKPVASSHQQIAPPDAQFAEGQALTLAVLGSGVEFRQNASVWGAFARDEILALVDGEAAIFRPRRLILATGAFERSAPMPGWMLEGVMSTGAAQTLVRSYQVSPGKAIVVAGNGPLNFQLAAELVSLGVDVAAVVESAPRPDRGKLPELGRAARFDLRKTARGIGYLATLKKAGVPVFWSSLAVAAKGQKHVTGVQIAPCGEAGIPNLDKMAELQADTLCLGYGFIASSEIARSLGCEMVFDPRHVGSLSVRTSDSGETSVPGVFSVGDGARIAGADVAMASGRLAGYEAASQLDLKRPTNRQLKRAARELKRARKFQSALWTLFKAPPVTFDHVPDDTILCRCEGLDFGRVRSEFTSGVASLGVLKRRTRLGMGRCQGRYCTAIAANLLAAHTGLERGGEELFAPRLPVKPFPASAIALEKPEWGGHRRSATPDLSRPVARESVENLQAGIVVIGGGVVGACVALELARSGHDVVVVERDDTNLQASGANAGSLHVQLLSFDFGDKAEASGAPAAATLPLGPWAVSLWQEIANEIGDDLGMRITGGLMVAETDEGMRFLEEKAALERSHGLQAEIIGASELRDMAPALSPTLVGAEYSPQEGKINPLTATYKVMEQAESLGARLLTSANVENIRQEDGKWLISTCRGQVRAGRIVNAAGSWAAEITGMIGQRIPVHSAPLQMIVTERAPELVRQLVAHSDRHLSLKQLANGGLVIGGAWTARYNASQRLNQTIRHSIEGNLWVANRVLPQLSGLHVIRSWAAMNVNIDGAPIIGEMPGHAGFFNAVTSNGYTLAPAVARLTADLINSGKTDLDISPFLIERF